MNNNPVSDVNIYITTMLSNIQAGQKKKKVIKPVCKVGNRNEEKRNIAYSSFRSLHYTQRP